MAKIWFDSDWGFKGEFEEKGFSEAINRAQVLNLATDALAQEGNKYIPEEIEGPERGAPIRSKAP